jgi:hypothetical protein
MPCWPDLWNSVFAFRWPAGPALVVVLIALFLWVPNIKWRWLRVLLRVTGGAAAVFAIFFVSFALLLNSGNTKPERRTTKSPSGLHQATVRYEAGFLGRDFSRVELTKAGSCKHFIAYEYEGPSDLTRTTVAWVDDWHLQIQYYADHERRQRCETRVADVVITCRPIEERKN